MNELKESDESGNITSKESCVIWKSVAGHFISESSQAPFLMQCWGYANDIELIKSLYASFTLLANFETHLLVS